MVPEGWEVKPLSEIAKEKISYGIVQAGPHVPDGVPYIKSSDVRGIIEPDDLQRTSTEIHYKYRRSAVHPGDIVFSLRGNIGESAIVPPELPEANLTQGTARISVSERHSNRFHFYQLASAPLLNRVNALSKGSTFKEISLEELRKVRVLCPPLPEQKKIAQILSTWDQAITATERLLENSQQRKKGLMQQLLTGKKRLPGFEGGWDQCRFSEIVTHRSGNSKLIKGKLATDPEAGLYPGYSASGQDVWLDHYEHQGVAIIVSAVGSRCGKCFYARGYWSAIANTHVIFPDENSVDAFFLNCFLNNEEFWIKGGSGQPFVKIKDTLSKTIMLPSIEEQRAITAVLSICEKECNALVTRLDLLKTQKKALMQQLLTGKRRVQVEAA